MWGPIDIHDVRTPIDFLFYWHWKEIRGMEMRVGG